MRFAGDESVHTHGAVSYRGTKSEISSVTFDPLLQAVGGDQSGGANFTGVTVPGNASGIDDPLTLRYLFMLANRRIGANKRVRLTGIRQFVTIGVQLPMVIESPTQFYHLEIPVRSPLWRFQDGNVSWSVRQVQPGPENPNYSNLTDPPSVARYYSQTPALLYAQTDAAGSYEAPPMLGQPLRPDLGVVHDLRFPWEAAHAWMSTDIWIEGPCDIALYASVRQTDPSSRAALPIVAPTATQLAALQLAPEDLFTYAFPGTRYWRVAGSLIFEDEVGANELLR